MKNHLHEYLMFRKTESTGTDKFNFKAYRACAPDAANAKFCNWLYRIPGAKLIFLAGAAVTGALLGGCYSYTPPPLATESDTFTQRKIDRQEELLDDVEVLSLETAQRVAVRNNPDYIAKYHAVSAARMRYYQALSAYLPTISANFSGGNTYNNYTHQVNHTTPSQNTWFTDTSLQASWLLFDGLQRTMRAMAQKAGHRYYQNLEEDSRRLLVRGVAFAYNDILLAIEKQRIALADMEFQLKNLRETQLKYQAGAVPLSDVLNFKIKVNDATGKQITAEYSYQVALYSLAVLMGFPQGTLPEHVKFPPIGTDLNRTLTSIEVYLDTALNNRPDLKAYRELLQVSRYNLYQAYGRYSPTVSARGALGYGTNLTRWGSGSNFSHSYHNNPSAAYWLEANWQLFDGFNRYNTVRESQALLAKSEFEAANTWLKVIEEVRAAYSNFVQNVKQARLYETTLGLVTKQRDLVEEEYKAGNTELTRLNEAQRDLVEAETNLVSALVNVQKAQSQLEAATHTSSVGLDTNLSTQY